MRNQTLFYTENLENPPTYLEMAKETHDWKVSGRNQGFIYLYRGEGKHEGRRCDVILLTHRRVPYSVLAKARSDYGFWGFREIVLEGKTGQR